MEKSISRRSFLKHSSSLGVAIAGGGMLAAHAADEVLKVAVVHVTPIGDIGWAKQHALAAEAIGRALPNAKVTSLENVFDPQDAERVFRQLASSGHKLIIGTSFSHGRPMQKVAPQFPRVAFEHCSGIRHLANLGTFEAKYFEGCYLAGIAAARVTRTPKIGFVGGFAIPDVLGMANGMLLGAQSVNPAAACSTIFLNSWYDPAKEKEAANTLIAQGCNVICSTTGSAAGSQAAEEKGAWSIGYASDMSKFAPTRQLTAFMLDWGSVYVKATQDVAAGRWKSEERWLGVKPGVVRMAPYHQSLPKDALALLAKTEAAIKAGTLHPFAGQLKDQGGKVRVAAGKVMPDTEIRSLNWLVQGMSGSLKS
jgi:basic membrane protein A